MLWKIFGNVSPPHRKKFSRYYISNFPFIEYCDLKDCEMKLLLHEYVLTKIAVNIILRLTSYDSVILT